MKAKGWRKVVIVFGVVFYATLLQILGLLSEAMEAICITAMLAGLGSNVAAKFSRTTKGDKE